MQKIDQGHLRVRSGDRAHAFGVETEEPVEIRVLKDTFWVRLCLMGDLGFAEAYMYGEVECDDLVALFKVFFF